MPARTASATSRFNAGGRCSSLDTRAALIAKDRSHPAPAAARVRHEAQQGTASVIAPASPGTVRGAPAQARRAGDSGEARKVFLDFYQREGSRHFRAEEEWLLPAFARHTRVDDPAIVRVLTEHVDLRGRGQDLERSTNPDPATLRELGERLESHIRFEERVLFPMIEEALPATSSSVSVQRSHAPRPTTSDVRPYLHLLAMAFFVRDSSPGSGGPALASRRQ